MKTLEQVLDMPAPSRSETAKINAYANGLLTILDAGMIEHGVATQIYRMTNGSKKYDPLHAAITELVEKRYAKIIKIGNHDCLERAHGGAGNKNAAKPEEDKVSADKIIFSAPAGTKARVVKASHGKPSSEFLRAAVAEKLEREGF